MTYAANLESAKQAYPFDQWLEDTLEFSLDPLYQDSLEFGLEQCTQENCSKAAAIFDTLIARLIALGPDAAESQKIEKFRTAVLALNSLNKELNGCFIETAEREDLCELCNIICRAAAIDPSQYGNGEGPASEWREW